MPLRGLIPGYKVKKNLSTVYRFLGPCVADGLDKLIPVKSVLSD
jgi:hypothetical protein